MPKFCQFFEAHWAEGNMPSTNIKDTNSLIYVTMKDVKAVDEIALVTMADNIPSPALSMVDKLIPASSLVWSLEFLHHQEEYSPEGWQFDTQMLYSNEGYANHSCTIWSPCGKPVALSRQSVAVFG